MTRLITLLHFETEEGPRGQGRAGGGGVAGGVDVPLREKLEDLILKLATKKIVTRALAPDLISRGSTAEQIVVALEVSKQKKCGLPLIKGCVISPLTKDMIVAKLHQDLLSHK